MVFRVWFIFPMTRLMYSPYLTRFNRRFDDKLIDNKLTNGVSIQSIIHES